MGLEMPVNTALLLSTPPRRASAIYSLTCLLALTAACSTGCEERVLSAKGLGSNKYSVSEPIYDPPEWERALMGDPPKSTRERQAPR